MIRLTIDSHEVEVEAGTTILHAADKLGIDIPTLCFNEACLPAPSCMVCVVEAKRYGPGSASSYVPACATIAEEGMAVETETDGVREARRTALELLLSDHLGDCMAPCQRACPAGMNIPRMIRQIVAGKLQDAIITVKRDIALPAVLGRICPAPCENVCRRKSYDSPVSICLLKRHAADADLMSESPYLPSCAPTNGRKVAIVGAGPAGLAAAYYLLEEGYSCVLFDDHEKPGGALRYAVQEDRLDREVLDAEIGLIKKLGGEFRMKTRIGGQLPFSSLQKDYDAVLIATGVRVQDGAGVLDADSAGDQLSENGIQIDKNTLQTDLKGVFAAGNATGRRSEMAVRSVADGKIAAASMIQYVSCLPVTGRHRPFNVQIGKLAEGEIGRFVTDASESDRLAPADGEGAGFSDQEARIEAARCLHCDCRKASDCKLRDLSEAYGADPRKYAVERALFEQQAQHPDIIYEPGKCIACGLCVQITSDSGEALGLTFIGRGFNVRVGVPLNRSISEGLQKVADQCVAVCPTGALAFK